MAAGPDTFFFALDGGGTRYRAALCDRTGQVIWTGDVPGGSVSRIGIEGASGRVTSLLEEGRAAAGSRHGSLASVVIGLAGARSGPAQEGLRETLGCGPESLVTHDAALALAGAFGVEGPGCVVVAGTGSIIAARDTEGLELLCGGWGWPLGDEGSATWLGWRAVQETAHKLETGEGTPLADAILKAWEVPAGPDRLSGLLREAAAARREPRRYARLAPVVLEAARASEEEAVTLVQQAGILLGITVARALGRLGWSPADGIPISVVGGFGREALDLLKDPMRDGAGPFGAALGFVAPLLEPVGGGLLMAAQAAGQGCGRDWIDRVRSTLSG